MAGGAEGAEELGRIRVGQPRCKSVPGEHSILWFIVLQRSVRRRGKLATVPDPEMLLHRQPSEFQDTIIIVKAAERGEIAGLDKQVHREADAAE